MARSGLRMMPTFPLSPLSFRTAGFPQYGWKAGISDSAFPEHPSLKPTPGIPSVYAWFASALRAPHSQIRLSRSVPGRRLLDAPPWSGGSTPPQGLSLRSGFFCPGPSTLISPIRPTRGHIAISPTMRLIRDAFAVRERLSDPQVVPSFRCKFLPGMPPSMSPGRSEIVFLQSDDSDMAFAKI